jgi:ribonuclease D
MNVNLITGKSDVNLFFNELKKSRILSVDTEFIREKTYYPVLSLIQFAVNNQVFIFDCLNKSNGFKKLKLVFEEDKYLKIFHDAEQDIEIINDYFSIKLKNYFDTQLANAFIDLEHHISYKNLVKKYLDVEIDKELQTSNWLKRPLSKKQITYAANDVIYLENLYIKLSELLTDQKKFQWYSEELENIICSIVYKKEPFNSWEKIKINDFSGINQDLLIRLSMYREEICRKRNIPKSWFLSDKNLIKLSSKKYLYLNDLKNEELTSNRYFNSSDYDQIFNSFDFSKTINQKSKTKRHNVKKYQVILENISKELNISQYLVANKKDLENYFGKNKIQIKGWRKKIFEVIKAKTNE